VRQPPPPRIAAVIGLAALLLAVLGGSAAAKPAPIPKTKTRTAPGRIEALAMDGTRVAYDVAGGSGPKARCNGVFVWNVGRNATTRVSGGQTCGADNTSTGAGVRELAVAGGRVAWIVNKGGNSESGDSLYDASVASAHERLIASAFRTGDVSGILTGNWLGGLVGSGTFMAVDHWATDSHGEVTTSRLQRIGTRLGDLAEGNGTMLAEATDGRQVAVLRGDGTIGLYSTRGALLRTVTPTHGATEVALRGDYLAALTTADTLEVYNSHSGRRLRTWRAAHGARSLDVSSGFATYIAPFPGGGYARLVHIRRLKSGPDRVLPSTPPQLIAVQIEPVGVVYALNRVAPGETATLVFVPMRRVMRTVRGA
jgi:hypothetical protein